jgi:hypothetical protein
VLDRDRCGVLVVRDEIELLVLLVGGDVQIGATFQLGRVALHEGAHSCSAPCDAGTGVAHTVLLPGSWPSRLAAAASPGCCGLTPSASPSAHRQITAALGAG